MGMKLATAQKLELIEEQIADARAGDPQNFEGWKAKTGVVLRQVLGDTDPLVQQFGKISYSLSVWTDRTTQAEFNAAQRRGVLRAVAILEAATAQLEIADQLAAAPMSPPANAASSTKSEIFIVHGRDGGTKETVARFISDLTGRKPIILHEQSNRGATLIEKLEREGERAVFAVVIATGDDVGRVAEDEKLPLIPRARQNVVLELGYFIALLGRPNVMLLLEAGVERPSDTDGIVYAQIDSSFDWRVKLANELDSAGIDVDRAAIR